MNSIHKVGLVVAGLVTALAIGGAFAFQGYMAAKQAQPTAAEVADVSPSASPSATAAPTDTLPPQIIYIAPAPTPAPATAAPAVVTPEPQPANPVDPATAEPTQAPTRGVVVTPEPHDSGGDD